VVIATAGSRRQVRALRRSWVLITRSTTAPRTSPKRALEITGGKGVDVVLDMVAGDYVARDSSAWPRTAASC
jgi:NADPH:quinone reductase-like Zn-dependent oxidoreductase